jgi:aldose 1-epimerase
LLIKLALLYCKRRSLMTASYIVDTEQRDGIEVFTLRAPDGSFAEIAPALGCNCFSFRTHVPVLEPVPFAEFRQKPTSYGIPILFPFPNRIKDGRFTFEGRTFEVNPPRHALSRTKPWTYRLRAGRLDMETVARNTGDANMPVGFGIHPYFRRPARGTLTVPAAQRWALADSLPTGQLLDVAGAFDLRRAADVSALQLDDIYTGVAADADGLTRCVLTDEDAGRQTIVEFDAREFPHVVVYTPPAPRAAICVEPNTCPTDAFNLQTRGIESNVLVLGAGRELNFNVRLIGR